MIFRCNSLNRNQEQPINLLGGNRTNSQDQIINESIEGLEYEFINAITALTENRKKIGMIVGHNEPDSLELVGFSRQISEYYDLYKIDLLGRRNPILGYDALVITKPTSVFAEQESF